MCERREFVLQKLSAFCVACSIRFVDLDAELRHDATDSENRAACSRLQSVGQHSAVSSQDSEIARRKANCLSKFGYIRRTVLDADDVRVFAQACCCLRFDFDASEVR